MKPLTLAPELEQKIRESATDGPMVMLLAELDEVRRRLADANARLDMYALDDPEED
jgi:hypothetical protein